MSVFKIPKHLRVCRYDTYAIETVEREKVLQAQTRCNQWLADGNEAKERGRHKRAEECYRKSQYWLDRYNKLVDNV